MRRVGLVVGLVLLVCIVSVLGAAAAGASTTVPGAVKRAHDTEPTIPSVFPRTWSTSAISFTPPFTVSLPLVSTACPPPPNAAPNTAVVAQEADLFAGPGNLGYAALAHLKPCLSVTVQGVFGDFAEVQVTLNGQSFTGFIYRPTLLYMPANPPVLTLNQVPWQNLDFANHLTLQPDAFFQGNDVVVDNSAHDYYNDDTPLSSVIDAPFRLSFGLTSSSTDSSSVKLADKPGRDAPDWWLGIRRVDFSTYNGQWQIDLRDGVSETSTATVSLGVSNSVGLRVAFLDSHGRVFVVADSSGHALRTVDVTQITTLALQTGLFPDGTVYFGCVTSPHNVLTIHSPVAELAPSGVWKQPSTVLNPPTFHQVAQALNMSTGTEYGWWLMHDPRYWDIMHGVYNTAILDEFSSTDFWLAPGSYAFLPVDRRVDWLIRNGYRVRASHLVWGAYGNIPTWLLNGTYTHDQYIQILHDHITTVVGHYQGRVTEWSIANEATSRSFGTGNDFWADNIGPEYVEMAFRWARQADPTGTLIFNDDNNQSLYDPASGPVASKMLSTVQSLKAAGVPIDVVGMQMHLFSPWTTQTPQVKADVISTMQQFAATGVTIYITEFDVNLHNIVGDQAQRWSFEAQQYRNMLGACIESGVCSSFSTWGISDANSWITCTTYPWCVGFPDADPLMFDGNFQPKPAFFAAYDVLRAAAPLSARPQEMGMARVPWR